MKEMKCLDCDEKFKANSPDEMMQTMMPHYKEAHAEMMAKGTEESKAVWMKKFHEDWEASEEV